MPPELFNGLALFRRYCKMPFCADEMIGLPLSVNLYLSVIVYEDYFRRSDIVEDALCAGRLRNHPFYIDFVGRESRAG